MELTEEKILEINKKCDYDQGVFFQPYGVPVKYSEKCVYIRIETGGYSGGSCWDDSDPQRYENDTREVKWNALDLVLSELAPNLSYNDYRGLEELIQTNEETEHEYYGNSTDWFIKYIPLSKLIHYLESR